MWVLCLKIEVNNGLKHHLTLENKELNGLIQGAKSTAYA